MKQNDTIQAVLGYFDKQGVVVSAVEQRTNHYLLTATPANDESDTRWLAAVSRSPKQITTVQDIRTVASQANDARAGNAIFLHQDSPTPIIRDIADQLDVELVPLYEEQTICPDGSQQHESPSEKSCHVVDFEQSLNKTVLDRWSSPWFGILIATYVLTLVGMAAMGNIGVSQSTMWIFVGTASLTLCLATKEDAMELLSTVGWPRLHGIHYIVASLLPGVNLFTVPLYCIQRMEQVTFGTALLSRGRIQNVIAAPRDVLRSGYRGVGAFVSVVLLTLLLIVPISNLLREGGLAFTVAGLTLFVIPIAAVCLHRYSSGERRNRIHYGLRDISVRVLAIFGLGSIATIALFLLLVPLAVIGGIIALVLPEEPVFVVSASILFALHMIPIAGVLVLPLRLLSWVKVLPYMLQDLMEVFSTTAAQWVSYTNAQEATDTSTTPMIPFSGHTHTKVEIKRETEIDMPGFYGYLAQSVEELDTASLSSSWRKGLLLAIPGYLYAVTAFSIVQLYPEQTNEYAAMLPADSILILSLNYIGIPMTVTDAVLHRLGFPPELLSIGLIGGIIPAILLIPASWHLCLEYEAAVYRALQRLGNNDHLLLLWTLHLVPIFPLLLVYWRYRDTVLSRITRPRRTLSRLTRFRRWN